MNKLPVLIITTLLAGCTTSIFMVENSFNNNKGGETIASVVKEQQSTTIEQTTIVPSASKPVVVKVQPIKLGDTVVVCPKVKLPVFAPAPPIGTIKSNEDLLKHIEKLREQIRRQRVELAEIKYTYEKVCKQYQSTKVEPNK